MDNTKDRHTEKHDGDEPIEPVKHECGSLFGCGDEKGTGIFREDVRESIGGRRTMDRLQNMDEVNQERLGRYLDVRGRGRRSLLKSGGLLGVLAAVVPGFARVAHADQDDRNGPDPGPGNAFDNDHDDEFPDDDHGRVIEVPSANYTVSWGVFDTTLSNIVNVDSGDVISYPNTWTNFFNQMQPGVSIDDLNRMRLAHPGRGVHSIIGPVGVNGAEPGDVLEIRYKRLLTIDFGAVFTFSGALGLLPSDFPQGQVRYPTLDRDDMSTKFLPGVKVPLQPFQGTLGVAPPDGYLPLPAVAPGVTSSVPPGPHAGNLDLRELSAGARLYIPVWKTGAQIFTGDSHAAQGDGEICQTALETAMTEMRIQVVLHKRKQFSWPFAETKTHWIAIGLDVDLNVAMTLAAKNAIAFLNMRAGLPRIDAYQLLSIAASFRVTQVVDKVRGVHVMIPKSLFSEDLREAISVV